eukprot:Ihof_evm28s6 gene=Ihof_evmTU28s6
MRAERGKSEKWLKGLDHTQSLYESWREVMAPVIANNPKGSPDWVISVTNYLQAELLATHHDNQGHEERRTLDLDPYIAHSFIFTAWLAHCSSTNQYCTGSKEVDTLCTKAYIRLVAALHWETLTIQSLLSNHNFIYSLVYSLIKDEEPMEGACLNLIEKVIKILLPIVFTVSDSERVSQLLLDWIESKADQPCTATFWLVCVNALSSLAVKLLDHPLHTEISRLKSLEPIRRGLHYQAPDYDGELLLGYKILEDQARSCAIGLLKERADMIGYDGTGGRLLNYDWVIHKVFVILRSFIGHTVHLPHQSLATISPFVDQLYQLLDRLIYASPCTIEPAIGLKADLEQVLLNDDNYADDPIVPAFISIGSLTEVKQSTFHIWTMSDTNMPQTEDWVWFDWLAQLIKNKLENQWEALDTMVAVPIELQETTQWQPPYQVPTNEWKRLWTSEKARCEKAFLIIDTALQLAGPLMIYRLTVRLLWLLQWIRLEEPENDVSILIYNKIRDRSLTLYQSMATPVRDMVRAHFIALSVEANRVGWHYNIYDLQKEASTNDFTVHLIETLNQLVDSDQCPSVSATDQSNATSEPSQSSLNVLIRLEAMVMLAPYDVIMRYVGQILQQKGHFNQSASTVAAVMPRPINERHRQPPPVYPLDEPLDHKPSLVEQLNQPSGIVCDIIGDLLYRGENNTQSDSLLAPHIVTELLAAFLQTCLPGSTDDHVIEWRDAIGELVLPYLSWDPCSPSIGQLVTSLAVLTASINEGNTIIGQGAMFSTLIGSSPMGVQVFLLLCALVAQREEIMVPLEQSGGSLDNLLMCLDHWVVLLLQALDYLQDHQTKDNAGDLILLAKFLGEHIQTYEPITDLASPLQDDWISSSPSTQLSVCVKKWTDQLRTVRGGGVVLMPSIHALIDSNQSLSRQALLAALSLVLPDSTGSEWLAMAQWLGAIVCTRMKSEITNTVGAHEHAASLLAHSVVLCVLGGHNNHRWPYLIRCLSKVLQATPVPSAAPRANQMWVLRQACLVLSLDLSATC